VPATAWVKSSYSAANGDCVEWRKSSHSNLNGSCVEVAGCQVRDSKDRSGPALSFTPDAWRAFVQAIKDGEMRA
jgi:hypothetical protein